MFCVVGRNGERALRAGEAPEMKYTIYVQNEVDGNLFASRNDFAHQSSAEIPVITVGLNERCKLKRKINRRHYCCIK